MCMVGLGLDASEQARCGGRVRGTWTDTEGGAGGKIGGPDGLILLTLFATLDRFTNSCASNSRSPSARLCSVWCRQWRSCSELSLLEAVAQLITLLSLKT